MIYAIWTNYKKSCIAFGIEWILMLILAIVLYASIGPWFEGSVARSMVIKSDPENLEKFKKPSAKTLTKLYLMNITNSEAWLNGSDAKLKVEQIGPYAYKDAKERIDIEFHGDGTVSYKEITRSFFVQELSEQNKPEVDIVIMPNVPLFAVASLIKVANNETLEKFMDAMDELEEENPQEVFIQNTVHKMLWGYDNPLTSLGDSLGMGNAKPKEESSDGPDKFGLMMGKNDTPAKSVRINTGEDDPSKMGQVQANNNKLFYGAWDLECDKISGKQFNSITSNLTMDTELEFSYQEMCRSLKFVADEKVVIEGVDGIKFIIHPDLLNYEAPENKCFCTRPDGEECKGWGYFELESCVGGLPIVTSLPHFLDSNAGDYFTMVEGFAPDPDLHKTTMILEPTLGFPLLINVKVQINLKITKSSLTDSLMNMPIGEGEEMFLPLFWLDAGMNDPDEEYYNKIKSALEAPEKAAGLVLIIGSAFLLIQLVLFFGICACLVKSKVGTEEAK